MDIQLRHLNKQFGQFQALNNINLDIKSGELLALLGPSGSGKTTLLRIIAGLEFADSGEVTFGGVNMATTPLRERQIGFVFQHYALFKHMTVRDNVGFGLSVKPRFLRRSTTAIKQRAEELLELVQLGGLGDRYPHQLSGGQRQRVALARALAVEPKVLLLDEPFGALDAKVRKELRQWLRDLHRQTGVTTIFVTHDQEEALELADRIVIMKDGQIAQIGSVDEVYEKPASPLVFDFLGDSNILQVDLRKGSLYLNEHNIADYNAPNINAIQVDGPVEVYIRPSDLRIANPNQLGIDVSIIRVQRTGPIVRATALIHGSHNPISIELPHLHHDTAQFMAGVELRLRLAQFSVYAPTGVKATAETLLAPVLIGRERERAA